MFTFELLACRVQPVVIAKCQYPLDEAFAYTWQVSNLQANDRETKRFHMLTICHLPSEDGGAKSAKAPVREIFELE